MDFTRDKIPSWTRGSKVKPGASGVIGMLAPGWNSKAGTGS